MTKSLQSSWPVLSHDHNVIGLYGGSFNPTHNGHINLAKTAHKAVGLSKVWMMVSPGNPLKDPKTYASLDHRMAMSHIMTEHDQALIEPTDFERHLHTNQTAEVLKILKEEYPKQQFVWIMGADNLSTFHKWDHWDYIMDNVPLLIMARPDQDSEALTSPVALATSHLRLSHATDLQDAAKGWCFFDQYDPLDVSASGILKSLRAGDRNVAGLDPRVERYILDHDLYDVHQANKSSLTPTHSSLKPRKP